MSCSSVRIPYRRSVRGSLHGEDRGAIWPTHGYPTITVSVPYHALHERVDEMQSGVSLSTLAVMWNEALPHLHSLVPTIRSDACDVIARCLYAVYPHHLPMSLSIDDAEIVLSWIVERLPNRAWGIAPLMAGVDAMTRSRLWSVIRDRVGSTDQYRMAILCQQIPPTLVPDVISLIPSLLTSTAVYVQTSALHAVMQWSRDPDPTIRSQIGVIIRSLLDQGGQRLHLHNRLLARAVLVRIDPASIRSDPSMISEIVAACTPEHSSVAMEMIAALRDVPYSVRAGPEFMTTLAQAIRQAKDQDVCERLALLMMDTVRVNGPLTAIREWVDLLWDTVIDPSAGNHRREALVKCLRMGLQWEPAATMICDRIRTTSSLPEVLPLPLLSDLVRVPWTPTTAETFLDLAESLVHSDYAGLVPVIIGEGWGSGLDARILQILTDHPNLINNPVDRIVAFRHGERSSLLPSLCRLIRSVAPDSADAELVRLYGTVPDMACTDRPDDRWSWVIRVSDRAVHVLIPVLKRVWEDHPGVAYELVRRIIEKHELDLEPYLMTIRSLSFGWGCGLDRFIADLLAREVRRKRSFTQPKALPKVMQEIIRSAAAGIGRVDPDLMVALFTQIMTPPVSHRTRIAVATALQSAWPQGDPTTILRILRMTRKRYAPDVDMAIVDTLRHGWGSGKDADLCTMMCDIATNALRNMTNTEYQQVLHRVIVALRDGWNRGCDAMILTLIDDSIAPWMEQDVSVEPAPYRRMVQLWTQTVMSGCHAIGVATTERLLARLRACSARDVIAGLAAWGATIV